MTRARQKAFDLGLKDFIVVSARSGYGMEELLGRIVTLVRTVYVACICETTYIYVIIWLTSLLHYHLIRMFFIIITMLVVNVTD